MASVSQAYSVFFIICFLAFFIQAHGRPGKPFHPCGPYLISISFSMANPKEDSLAFAMPVEKGSFYETSNEIGVYKEVKDLKEKRAFYSWGFTTIPFDLRRPIHSKSSAHRRIDLIRRRTNDILSILIALLFGVVCGAITCATMYVVWAIVTRRYRVLSAEKSADPLDLGYQQVPASAKEGLETK